MASGERITLTYSSPARHANGEPLKLDVYAFVPKVDPIDPGPTFSERNRLPFILFLHGGHFLTGSKRDVPAWLASMARSMGIPLLCADYRLAPHAGPGHAFEDIRTLWTFIREELNWIIACSGNGAEVESGNEMLEEDFGELQRRGGIDIERGIVIGLGAGGHLAALGGALLSPPPIALVLGYPLLEIEPLSADSPGYFVPANTPGHLRPLLNPDNVGKTELAKCSVPDLPMLLDKAPYAQDMRARSGMDVRERWIGREESVRRQGMIDFLSKQNRLSALLRKASPDILSPSGLLMQSESDAASSRRNSPYPPTLIYHGLRDTMVPASNSQRFIEVVRAAEPVAATMDALAEGAFGKSLSFNVPQGLMDQAETDMAGSGGNTNSRRDAAEEEEMASALRCVPARPNHTSRYLFLGIDGQQAGHAFDVVLPRELRQPPFSRKSPIMIGDRYKASLIHIEHFLQHWLLEGSAERAAAQEASRSEQRKQKRDVDASERQQSADASRSAEQKTHAGTDAKPENGARIRLPVRGPRL